MFIILAADPEEGLLNAGKVFITGEVAISSEGSNSWN
jgi:hypothetical protein